MMNALDHHELIKSSIDSPDGKLFPAEPQLRHFQIGSI